MAFPYSWFAILVLTGVFFLGFRSERNMNMNVNVNMNIFNDLLRLFLRFDAIQEGTFLSSEMHDSVSTVSAQMVSFEEWLLLHKVGNSRHKQGNTNNNTNDSIQNSFYSSPEEFAKRQKIYQDNLSRWALLNQMPVGARYGPEKEPHADRTPHEFAQLVASCYRTKDETRPSNRQQHVQRRLRNQRQGLRSKWNAAIRTTNGHHHQTLQHPFTLMDVDWRAHAPPDKRQTSGPNTTNPAALVSYVTPVKNQGPHGTCWSFAAAENLEGLTVRQGHSLQNISEQEFISCCSDCQGRSADHTFSWLLQATDGVPALEES